MAEVLTPMRRQILEFIITCQRERNFPPTIREIGDHVGLKSPATVANHIEVLKNAGFIEKNPQQPRTLTVRLDAENPVPRPAHSSHSHSLVTSPPVPVSSRRRTSHELMSIPEQFAGRGDSFVLQVRGDSMIEAGILPGDFVVVQRQSSMRIPARLSSRESTMTRPRLSAISHKERGSSSSRRTASSSPWSSTPTTSRSTARVISVLRSY
jgi:repressor LexA